MFASEAGVVLGKSHSVCLRSTIRAAGRASEEIEEVGFDGEVEKEGAGSVGAEVT